MVDANSVKRRTGARPEARAICSKSIICIKNGAFPRRRGRNALETRAIVVARTGAVK
ncbi:hypothetical protein BN2497_995 [Janthinobacterium sp. CG23_2]|nr:hypothetical protein BN2497_995 [Janthinobacterium sp. CG23_2]CUU26895.1 hypothetical protein BN3177_995 [Janthinobacterium sp. CG23_2]